MPRYYMDPDYLLDELEQEWEETVVVASDLPTSMQKRRKKPQPSQIVRERRSQASRKNTAKDTAKIKKEKAVEKKKAKKKLKVASVNSGDNLRNVEKEKRVVVIEIKREIRSNHGRGRRNRCQR
eukprot:CAMPEP_0202712944 /NCGR_PEP_ID=MMETSP1385-20130828/47584_1 /ASSEMBLY_ACC=CAM_ASM_000861 /TAXON_ID=933848 /ORGANISM="Elphidium margaritaceum" /LENGTH=123 /DNA_ID=CAMNT_0049373143 /DNA_START=90 /DNA_END=458 /DNA_ORIENTATION=+